MKCVACYHSTHSALILSILPKQAHTFKQISYTNTHIHTLTNNHTYTHAPSEIMLTIFFVEVKRIDIFPLNHDSQMQPNTHPHYRAYISADSIDPNSSISITVLRLEGFIRVMRTNNVCSTAVWVIVQICMYLYVCPRRHMTWLESIKQRACISHELFPRLTAVVFI